MNKVLLPLISLGMLSVALLHVVRASQKGADVEPPVPPARSPYSRTVAGAGIVEARTENIAIGSDLPGVVADVLVKVGDQVKAGDPLFRLDARALQTEVQQRQAALELAQMQLRRLEAQPREEERLASRARLREAEANFADQRDLYTRGQNLSSRQAMSPEEWDRRRYAYQMAQEQLARARADNQLVESGAWSWDKEVARSQVELARAQLQQARTDLERLEVKARVPGTVLQVNVRPGEYVGTPPGQALVLLGDISRLHVRVDIDENDIPRFRKGTPARAVLRGAPEHAYPLRFVRVEHYVTPKRSLTGDTRERVDTRVLQVIYELLPVDGKPLEGVYVGQQVDVFLELPEGPGPVSG